MKSIIKRIATVVAASVMSVVAVQSATAGGDIRDDYRPALWQGGYIGGHIGGTFGEYDDGLTSYDVDGFVGGVHIGYNFQNGKAVYGIEGDFTFSGAEFDHPFGNVEQDYLASIRGRIGYAMDKTLIYATGGVAWTQLSVDGDEGDAVSGYVVGAGVEHKYSDKISLRGEILHYGFEDDFDDELVSTVLRAGINWHLN